MSWACIGISLGVTLISMALGPAWQTPLAFLSGVALGGGLALGPDR